jgi:hypothetical protein
MKRKQQPVPAKGASLTPDEERAEREELERRGSHIDGCTPSSEDVYDPRTGVSPCSTLEPEIEK